MKKKNILILVVIMSILLFGMVLQAILSDLKKGSEYADSKADKFALLSAVDDGDTEEPGYRGSRSRYNDVDFIDDEMFGIIKDSYSKIDFVGEFKKGDTSAYDFYKEQYLRLLKCEAPFFDRQTQKEHFINEFGEMNYTHIGPHLIYNLEYSDIYDPANYIYYFFDMDGDGMPELCVTNEVRFVYIMKYIPETASFILWHEIPPSMTVLMGSGKLRLGGGTTAPAMLTYCRLDKNGDEELFVRTYVAGYYNVDEQKSDVIYAVALPEFTDGSKNIRFSENMKKQAFVSEFLSEKYFFRVTEAQWGELTKDFLSWEAQESAGERLKEVRFAYEELFGEHI